ncbi:UDP-GlcNAc:betaGal beta-1,3-N-acetylglucosaminyltransferase 9-like [Asterias rubens]|uniref:UDP-GlcNAc:betaGal beta-1,3-N-acetylglucosaminyltransferase 9-like n=1 Tax=Asterias rubens TaxID=7604 RepID=UPI0014550B6E|nr:UDP-GlcNAc:betaGal beta-1,3-N-acetylglucosaminyltransferase 9-like [Asterias rubens]
MVISRRRRGVTLMVLTFTVTVQLYFVVSSLNKTSPSSHSLGIPAKVKGHSYYTTKSKGLFDNHTQYSEGILLSSHKTKPDDDQIFKKADRKTRHATKSPQEYILALKEKYKHVQYRLSCRYNKTQNGLSKVCFDRFKNGSMGMLTAQAVFMRRENFTSDASGQDRAGVKREHGVDRQSVFNEEDPKIPEAPPELSKPIYNRKHRVESIAKKPVLKARHSPKPGIMNNTRWVAFRDVHNYRYLVNPSFNICTTGGRRDKRVDLLVLVTSHPDHSERRDVIRETWGARGSVKPTLPMPVVRVLFLLGVTSLESNGGQQLSESLQKEVNDHNDIIVEEFLDTYLNLTLKTVMGLKWASRHCQTARFVMKTDDDMIINMPRLLAFLHKEPQHAYIAGRLAKAFPVVRDPSEKFYVPGDIYAPSTYPDYCIGLGYIMSSDVVNRLYLQSLLTKLFPWEDVFVGILLKQIGIIPRDIRNFYYFKGDGIFEGDVIVNQSKVFFHLRSYYVLDGLTPKQSRILWKQWQQS